MNERDEVTIIGVVGGGDGGGGGGVALAWGVGVRRGYLGEEWSYNLFSGRRIEAYHLCMSRIYHYLIRYPSNFSTSLTVFRIHFININHGITVTMNK